MHAHDVVVPADIGTLNFDYLIDQASQSLQIPTVLYRVLECAANDESEIEELVELIAIDPIFASRIIRLANCPVYFRGANVENLHQAVMRIGRVEIHALCSVCICLGEAKKLDRGVLRAEDFLYQSLFSAFLAKDIAAGSDLDASTAFTAALLQGLGILVLIYDSPDDMERLMFWAIESGLSLPSAVQRAHGFDTFELSAAIARLWAMPEPMVVAIESVGESGYDGRHAELADCVRTAVQWVELCAGESLDLDAGFLDSADPGEGASSKDYRATLVDAARLRTEQILSYL